MGDRLIVEAAVAQLWRVYGSRPYYWRMEGRFDSTVKDRANRGFTHFYTLEALDALHQQWARGFPAGMAVPTTEEMLAVHGHALLKSDEAAALTGKTPQQIRYGLRDEFLPFIQIVPGRVLRLPASSLLAVMSADTTVTPETARKVLLLADAEHAIDKLGRSGHLERVHKNGTREWQVDRASLEALLLQQTEGSVDPGEWWRRNTLETRPPLTKLQVIQKYHVASETIEAEMAAGRLAYLRTAGGWVMIPQWALDGFIERRTAWTADKITSLFGVPEGVAANWIERKALCKIRHGNAPGVCPSGECVRRYITDNRTSTSFTADQWITWSMQDGATPVLDGELVAQTVGVDHIDVTDALANDTLRGVYLPRIDGENGVAIIRSDAVAWRRTIERQLRHQYE